MVIQFFIFTLVFLSIILLMYFLGVVISHLIYTIQLNKQLDKLMEDQDGKDNRK